MVLLVILLSIIVKQNFVFQKVLLGPDRSSFEDMHISLQITSFTSATDGDITEGSAVGLSVSFY